MKATYRQKGSVSNYIMTDNNLKVVGPNQTPIPSKNILNQRVNLFTF